jgi:hypothetical protein
MRALWPLHGVTVLLKHPALWRRPFLALLIAWVALLGAGVGVGWWRWPAGPMNWWPYPLHASIALGLSLATMLLVWIVALPLLMSLAMEHLAREVQRLTGAPPARDESFVAALGSTLLVMVRTLHLRLGWTGLSLVCSFFGPLGVIIAAFGMAHMASIDALDTALVVRGIPGRRRLELLRIHRDDLINGALAGSVLNLALGLTVVGWVVWLPSLVAGAATRVLTWPEVASGRTEPGAVAQPGA